MSNMLRLFKIGDKIGGFCNGFFGRDDYKDKTCIFVACKYAIFEYEDGTATVLNYENRLLIYVNTENWIPTGELY